MRLSGTLQKYQYNKIVVMTAWRTYTYVAGDLKSWKESRFTRGILRDRVDKARRLIDSEYVSFVNIMFIGPCVIVIVEEWKTNLMSLAILFHFLCAQHISDINISIIRSLRLCSWITTSVVLFSVRCVLEIWCGWFWVVLVLQAEAS